MPYFTPAGASPKPKSMLLKLNSCSRNSSVLLLLLQEQFINDREFLLSACTKCGVDAAAAAKVFDGGDPDTEQLLQQELGKYTGISGVPHFIFNGR